MRALGMSLLLWLAAAPSAAQQPGDAGVFFDAEGTVTTSTVEIDEFFYFYIVVFDAGPMMGWEGFAVADAVFGPTIPELTVVNYANNPPGSLDADGGASFLECVDVQGAFWLRSHRAVYFVEPRPDDLYCLEASDPSSLVPPAPGYSSCSDDLIPFGVAENGGSDYPDGCAVMNPTGEPPVGMQIHDWSALKEAFR